MNILDEKNILFVQPVTACNYKVDIGDWGKLIYYISYYNRLYN